MNSKIMLVGGGLALTAGCMSSYVSWVEKGTSGDPIPAGNYALVGSRISDNRIKTGKPDGGDIPAVGSPMPVEVNIKSDKSVDTTGGLAMFNNVFSYCTLGIWPLVSSERQDFTVTVKPPESNPTKVNVSVEKRQWTSFIFPIALLPCPGVGEERGAASGSNSSGNLYDFGYAQCEKEVCAVLNKNYYEEEMGKFIAAKKQWHETKMTAAGKIQQMLAATNVRKKSHKDTRSVVLLDMKDIQDRTSKRSQKDRDAVGDISAAGEELESTLSRLGFRVLSKRSIGRSMEEQAVFSALSNNNVDKLEVETPAYRIEGVVFQYGVEEKHDEKMFQGNGVWGKERIHKMVGRVEFALKFINIRTGETEYATPRVKKEVEDSRKVSEFIAKNGPMGTGQGANAEPMVPEKILSQALHSAFESLARDISIKLKPFHVVECSDDAMLTIDAPEVVVKPGSRLQLLSLGQARKTSAGKTYRQETPVAVVQVCNVSEDSCTAKFVSIDKIGCDWNVIVKPMAEETISREHVN